MGNLRSRIVRKDHPVREVAYMRYQNTKTGFIFESDSECKGEDWVELNSRPASKNDEEEKPKTVKRTKKNGNS